MSARAMPATVPLLLSGTAAAQTSAKLPHPSVGDSFRYSGNFATVACPQWTVTAVDRKGWETVRVPGGASGQAHEASWYASSTHTVVEARNDQQPQWNFQLLGETLH